MNSTSSRAEALFMDALSLPSAQRPAYLDRACNGDPALRARLDVLLSAHESAAALLDAPAGARPLDFAAEEKAGETIDRYRLLEKLGEGGCGAVWAAEQREPVKRRVALKIIKLGMDTRQVIARFEAERQALAMMDHPNIARMLDAGATAAGRPYFVMELVRGIPITAYCDENNLTTAQRLELLIKVCHAIQHAHQKGIIHRDIKPSNVLVTLHDGEPVPKVIDFGIAKATQQELTEKTIYTRFQQFIGTPAYMSPEQVEMSGLDIDTRSDIYSLGVLVYELVTGRTPFDSRALLKQGVDEIRRAIRETEPPRPSMRLSTMQNEELTTAARRRSTDPRKLAASVRGDLDWVVMKCLEKDRTRRYETANALSADIQRYLGDEPVVARPPSTAYRVSKFIRRHRVGFAAGATVLGVIVVGSLVTTTQALRALRAERTQNELRESALRAATSEEAARRTAEREQLRNEKIRWARETAMPEITELRRKGDNAAAFALAKQAEEYISDDPALKTLWPRISVPVTVETTPEGAELYVKLYRTPEAKWEYVGKAPLKGLRLPKEAYRWQARKEGYVVAERVHAPNNTNVAIAVQIALQPVASVPPEMTYVTRGRGVGHMLRGATAEEVEEFWIDKYEVTNRQFKEFVDAGGYSDERYWRQPIVRDGETLSWQTTMTFFRDTTGRSGPAAWKNGTYRDGEGDYPVTGVSWFEAAAFAEWAGKRLPSIYHWHRAAGPFLAAHVVPLSNFNGRGLTAVGKHHGMSWFGAYDMAGNAKEWCWNEAGGGTRYQLGGSWADPDYMFGQADAVAPFDRARTTGFRCIKLMGTPAAVLDAEVVRHFNYGGADKPADDEVFRAYRGLFAYEKTPLESRVEKIVENDPRWRLERVSFNAAYGNERVPALVFLPRNVAPPYQTVLWFPGTGAVNSDTSERITEAERFAIYTTSGRAVVYPVYKGTHERKEPWQIPLGPGYVTPASTVAYRDSVLQWSKDFSRTIDYLETRSDIRPDKLAYIGFSWGGMISPVILAVDPRPKVAVLWSGGLMAGGALPEVNQVNFAPRVRIPVLMLNGRYDYTFPVEISQRVLLRLLGTAPDEKNHILFEAPHPLTPNQGGKESVEWLDRFLGPAK